MLCANDIITPMKKIKLVETASELELISAELKSVDWIGIDTEFLREKTYYPQLCLIQVHSEIGEWCIDPLIIKDVSSFGEILSSSDICKIFHSCRQDLEALERCFPESLSNLYDTQLAASFCGAGDQLSYAALVKEVIGIELSKNQTRTDWSARPLSESQVQYAIDDVRYLKPIQAHLNLRLVELGRESWQKIECESILEKQDYIINPDEAWRRLKGGAKIPVKFQRTARRLALWREHRAQTRDRPREWILPSRSLVDICFKRPNSVATLAKIEGLPAAIVRHSGRDIIEIVQQSPVDNQAERLWYGHAMLDKEQKSLLKTITQHLRSVAEKENMSQALLANRSDLESLIQGDRNINLMKGWRFDFVGKEIEALLI